jgi:hypothetical protein
MVQEQALHRSPVVRMVVEDLDAKQSGACIEGSLCKWCIGSLCQLLEAHKRQATEMVDKHCDHLAPFAIEKNLVLPNKTSDWGFELVHGDTLTRFGHCLKLPY